MMAELLFKYINQGIQKCLATSKIDPQKPWNIFCGTRLKYISVKRNSHIQ